MLVAEEKRRHNQDFPTGNLFDTLCSLSGARVKEMNQQVSKASNRQKFHIVNIDAIRNPSPLSCEPLYCVDGFSYRGYSLNGIPVLIGDVLEYEKSPGIWKAVEYWPDPIKKRWFSELETDASFDLTAAAIFRWPLKEAAHLVREHTKDRDAIKKKHLRS